uniref:Uncharacterized protein n=1 Tax=Meloidogyne incognita TaxID=6306 RepID=A0A914M9T5_MELIC
MNVLNYVKNNSEEVNIERLLSLPNVKATISSLPNNQSTLIMFLNRHIIQMTINWLCNTQHMEGNFLKIISPDLPMDTDMDTDNIKIPP